MRKVYIVTREGVYRHEIIGVYLTLKSTRRAAITALDAEHDSYHDFHVIEYNVGVPINDDGKLLYIYKKDDGIISVNERPGVF